MAFVTETDCVLCEVRTKFLKIIYANFRPQTFKQPKQDRQHIGEKVKQCYWQIFKYGREMLHQMIKLLMKVVNRVFTFFVAHSPVSLLRLKYYCANRTHQLLTRRHISVSNLGHPKDERISQLNFATAAAYVMLLRLDSLNSKEALPTARRNRLI
jgi:hypothetical protein